MGGTLGGGETLEGGGRYVRLEGSLEGKKRRVADSRFRLRRQVLET